MRLLILSSSTGGGHDMRARSLEAWSAKLSTETNPITTDRYQALEETAGIYKFGVGIYNFIQKTCPWLHHAYFNWLEIFQISASEKALLGKANYIAKLEASQPDVIVSVHAHTNHAFRAIAKRVLPNVKFVTYCGEMFDGYGFSKHWVDPQADAFIGATSAICRTAKNFGMPKERVKNGGFMLDPEFYAEPYDAEQRAEFLQNHLNLSPEKFTLLLSTGANGALNHQKFIQVLAESRLPIQVIALCGKNEIACRTIEQIAESTPELPIRALSYREDMYHIMQCSDAIIARPGTGTTSEAIMAGCPMIFNTLGGVMPQEWITVKYMRDHGLCTKRIKKAQDLVDLLTPLTQCKDHLQTCKNMMSALRPANRPADIIQFLIDLAK